MSACPRWPHVSEILGGLTLSFSPPSCLMFGQLARELEPHFVMIPIARPSVSLPVYPQCFLYQLYCSQARGSAARVPCPWKYPSKHHVHRPIRVSNYTTKSIACARQQPCIYESIPEAENLENYKPSGFHPILIGDILHSRYRVVPHHPS